jgi:hypothetical protein
MITSPEELPEKRPVFTSDGCVDLFVDVVLDKTVRPSRFKLPDEPPRPQPPALEPSEESDLTAE